MAVSDEKEISQQVEKDVCTVEEHPGYSLVVFERADIITIHHHYYSIILYVVCNNVRNDVNS